jgi:sulfate transporter 1, high-affinity
VDISTRLGFLIDFLSHAAIVGFMGGAAITIALQQLKGFLGIQKFTKKTDIISVMNSVFSSAHHGVCFLSLYVHMNINNEILKYVYVRVYANTKAD